MESARIWGSQQLLLLLLLIRDSGLQDPLCAIEGQDQTLRCVYNIRKYGRALKGWERLGSDGQWATLVKTNQMDGEFSQVQAGRYLLIDNAPDAMMNFTIQRFQKQDSGKYRCVVYQPPLDPFELESPFQLTTCDATIATAANILTPWKFTPRREKTPTTLVFETSSLPNPHFFTQAPVKSTTYSLTTTLGAKHNETIFSVLRFSDMLAVTFGILLNKILVSIILYIFLRKMPQH